jgi:hypothetical protein
MKKLCLNLMLLLAAVAAEAALTLLNNSAVDVTTNSATLRCTVTSTNGVAWTNVTYYGTINGGTTPAYWQFAATNAAPVLGTNSVAVTDLAPGTRYYFRSSAVDPSGVAWAATFGQFVTTALAPTSSPPAQLTTPLLVDTNGLIVAPANFATANSLADAGSLTAVAGRITGIEARSNAWNAAASTTINGQPLAGTNLVIESGGASLPAWATNQCRELSIVGTNVVMDGTAAEFSKVILTTNVTMQFTNFTGRACWVLLQQDEVGGHLIDWPDNLLWSSNAVLQVSTNAGSGDIVKILHDGDTYFAEINGTQYRDRPLASFAGPTALAVGAEGTWTNTTLGPRTGSTWDFGDGSILTNNDETVTHSYSAAGTNTVTLTTLGRLANSTATGSVVVADAHYAIAVERPNQVRVPNSPAFYPSSGTVEFWFYPTQASYDWDGIVAAANQWPEFTGGWYVTPNLDQGGAVLSGRINNSGQLGEVTTTNSFVQNEWNHLAFAWSGSGNGATELTIWLNGAPNSAAVAFEMAPYTGDFLVIRPEKEHSSWVGRVDELRVSNVVRYNGSFVPSASHALDSSTVAYWSFNEGDGAIVGDKTGNHNGTLQGDPLPQWVAGKE